MAKTNNPKPSEPKPVPSHGNGGKPSESREIGTGPRSPKK